MTDLIKRKDVYEALEKYFKGGFGSIYDMVEEIPTVEVADRKTENSSEKPNNCETCRHYTPACDLFSEICKYEPKDEPQPERSSE